MTTNEINILADLVVNVIKEKCTSTHTGLEKLELIEMQLKHFEDELKSQGGDVWGCTDKQAQNFNRFATIDDGSCIYTATQTH